MKDVPAVFYHFRSSLLALTASAQLGWEARQPSTFSPTPISTWQILPLFWYGERRFLCVALRLCRKPWFLIWRTLVRWGCLPGRSSRHRCPDPDHVDYARLHATRLPSPPGLTCDSDRASHRFPWSPNRTGSRPRPLLRALHDHLGQPSDQWPDVIRRREPDALNRCRRDLPMIDFQIFLQYHSAVAPSRPMPTTDISILGIRPSTSLPTPPKCGPASSLFQLDEDFRPPRLRGRTAGRLSEVGQHWGNFMTGPDIGRRSSVVGERMKRRAPL